MQDTALYVAALMLQYQMLKDRVSTILKKMSKLRVMALEVGMSK